MLSAAAALVSNNLLSVVPFDVGPASKSFNGIGVGVSVAQVAGTTVTRVGIYNDDGSGGYPKLTGGPLQEGSIVLTTAPSNPIYAPASPFVLAPGRYWLAFQYSQSVAPTTMPQVMTINSATTMWQVPGSLIGSTTNRGMTASQTGPLTTLPTVALSGLGPSATQCAVVALRAT